MKTKITLSIFLLSAFLMMAGCKKENSSPNNGSGSGTTVTTGTLYFQNTQSDPYKIEVDGYYKMTVSAGATSAAYSVTGGVTYTLKATQASGYVFYPTVINGSANVGSGGSVTWSF